MTAEKGFGKKIALLAKNYLPIALSMDPNPPFPPRSLRVATTVASSGTSDEGERIRPLDCKTTSETCPCEQKIME